MFINFKNIKKQKNLSISRQGFTIIELIISIFILTAAIIGIYSAFYTVIVQTSVLSSRFTASYLAQEGLEIIRNIRDSNWVRSVVLNSSASWDDVLSPCYLGCQVDYKTKTSDGSIAITPYGDGDYLNIKKVDGFYTYETTDVTQTKFKRKITVSSEGGYILKVIVEVTWNDRGQDFKFSAEEYLYNWY